MPIFRRESELEDAPESKGVQRTARPQATTGSSATRIAPGTQVVGEITGATDVVIEGDLQGEVRIEGKVRVVEGGRVRGGLQAGELEIGGQVRGDVVGRERIRLDASAELHGNLSAPRVVIDEGAFFKGEVEMGGEPRTLGTRAPSKATREASSGRGSEDTTDAGSDSSSAKAPTDSTDSKDDSGGKGDSR